MAEGTAGFLQNLVADFASGLKAADSSLPRAVNARSKKAFHPGIGPHTEGQTLQLVSREMALASPERYESATLGIPYPEHRRQKCDLAVKTPSDTWFIEVKMWRLMGDNGKPNDNILMHIVSPYPQHRSALTDCDKLLRSGFTGRRAILIYGYEAPGWPFRFVIDAFEVLAGARVELTERCSATFDDLCHPIHRSGAVYAWELLHPERPPAA